MIPIEKLQTLARRNEEIDQLMCEPAVLGDRERLTRLNRERAQLLPVIEAFQEYRSVDKQIADDREALGDPDLGPLAREELPSLEARLAELERELQLLLLPRDPNDDRNTLLEIRAGTGGEEAALFAADLFRMYTRYAEGKGWRVEILNQSEASAGGFKEVVALVSGERVYSSLRYEGGVHRVQRVPATEAQGRIHTSTATVAVLPEADEVDVHIDDKDLRIDIAASGGPGGQGVNTTNSAVQITHLPTGMIVKCQDERSQLKNKAKALKILRSRLLDIEEQRRAEAVRDERRDMVKAGDRSEKIRTYNYPQNRLTDHRIGLTLHRLDAIVGGDLEEVVDALVAWHQAARLESAT
ncbi:MAG: peptide chain release factor 1 [Sorangiineae bacterium]|nr:peptide chain release factor 1 [Polyangiaceae bacterium]MEB2321130.1 peptide chain release factor 1 [Sorangiineae bacterium]